MGVFSIIQPHAELVIVSLAEVETHASQFPMDEEIAEAQWQNLASLRTDVDFMDFLRAPLGLDPTNNCIANKGHVRMAIGRNFADCTPAKGTYKGTGAHTLEVSVHIENGHRKRPTDTGQ